MYRSLIFALLCISSVLSGGSKKSGALDGSYRFTTLSLDSPFQINVCTNPDGETYMSMNVVNTADCDESNYILGVYRDLSGAQKIGDDTLALIMNGFQREYPSGNKFDEMTYKIECDTKMKYKHKCILSRDNGAATFKLEKISNTATVNCYKPNGKFAEDISFPAYYRTTDDISECNVCAGTNPCFEEQSVNDADLTDACWAFTDNNDAFAGGEMTSVNRVWEGQLSLENYGVSGSQIGVGVSGSQFTVLDGTNIVFSWRNVEGTQGYLYTMEQINLKDGINDPGCPLFQN